MIEEKSWLSKQTMPAASGIVPQLSAANPEPGCYVNYCLSHRKFAGLLPILNFHLRNKAVRKNFQKETA
jgi:hypothetical protein